MTAIGCSPGGPGVAATPGDRAGATVTGAGPLAGGPSTSLPASTPSSQAGSAPTPLPAGPAGSAPGGTKPAANGGTALIAGTDSQAVTPGAVSPALQANLVAFGRAYLGYDYRADPSARVDALRPVTAPPLLNQLSQQLPPALAQQLRSEHRVVTADAVSVAAVDTGVYQVVFTVHTAADGLPASQATSSRTLTVTVDAQQRVSDVR